MSRRSRGFTFIELMYAGAFFLFGLVGVIATDTAANNQIAQAEHQHRAAQLARSTMGLCRLLPSAQVQAMSTPVSLNYDANGKLLSGGSGASFYQVTSSASSSGTSAANVKVRVQWLEPSSGVTRTVTLEEIVPTS